MKKLTLLIPFLLLTNTSNSMWEKLFGCNNQKNCGITQAEAKRLGRYATEEGCPKALLLAYTCEKFTREEIMEHEKSILENPEQVTGTWGKPEIEWVLVEETSLTRKPVGPFNQASYVLSNRKKCKAEGCLALQEIFKKAENEIKVREKQLKKQKAQELQNQVKKIVDDSLKK